MDRRTAKILDECLDRIGKGESIDSCLADYTYLRDELKPLLEMALKIKNNQVVSPSDEFIQTLENRLAIINSEKQTQPVKAQKGIRYVPIMVASTYRNKIAALFGNKNFAFRTAIAVVLVIAIVFVASDLLIKTPTPASACTLSILSGSTGIKESGSEIWEPAIDGMTLTTGSSAKTSLQSYSLLTFTNGCTVKLQPETEIEIKQLEFGEGKTDTIILKQTIGTTWSHITGEQDSFLYYEIETPSAIAVASGTSFTTEVIDTGKTRVVAAEGTVRINVNGEELDLPAGLQVEVQSKGRSPQVSAVPAPNSFISVTVDEPAVVSVIDSTGSSIGLLPGGLSFSQIPGAVYSTMNNHKGTITIPDPVDGRYKVALRYHEKGEVPVNIQAVSKGDIAFEYSGIYEGTKKSGWLIECDIDVENGSIAGGELVNVELLGDETPEKALKVKPIEDKDKSQKNKDKQDKGKNQNNESTPNQNNNQDNEGKQNQHNNQGNTDKQKSDKEK